MNDQDETTLDPAPPNPPENPPGPPPVAPVAPVASGPPPAARIVLEGTKTEREVALERTLKARETRLSELEDENRRLKAPAPTPEPLPEAEKRSWLDGATFFDDDE